MRTEHKRNSYMIIFYFYIVIGVIDIMLRVINGSSITDVLFGHHIENGIYSYIWFKADLVWSGQLWRILTWPFFSMGLLHYVIEACILLFVLRELNLRIGSKKVVSLTFGLIVIILFGSYFSYIDKYNDIAYNYGIVSIAPLLYGMIGSYFTLLLIDNNQFFRGGSKRIFVVVLSLMYLLYGTVNSMSNGSMRFIIFYSFSIGMLLVLLLRSKNLTIVNNNRGHLFKGFDVKKYPFTFMTILLCLVSFLLNVVLIDNNLLIGLYGEATFSNWIQFFLFDGDYGYVASKLLSNTEMIKSGEYWRIFTHVFSHTGLIHLLTNIPAIYFSGRLLEKVLGTKKVLIIYLLSSATLSLFNIIEGVNTTTMGGSSLGLYALFAAYLVLVFRKDNGLYGDRIGFLYVLLYFILGNVPSIGNFGTAHLTSYMTGMFSITLILRFNKMSIK